MDLHRTLLKDVILPKIRSVFVIDYYEGLRSLLESRGDFPYKEIFANPRVRSKTEIIWSTDAFTTHPTRLVDLTGEEKERFSYLLYKEIENLLSLIETLKTEEGGQPLSELLSRTVSNIDERSVYCGDGKVVLVNWGIIPRQPNPEGSGIYRSGKFVGDWDKAHMLNPERSTGSFIADDFPIKSGSDAIETAHTVTDDDSCAITNSDDAPGSSHLAFLHTDVISDNPLDIQNTLPDNPRQAHTVSDPDSETVADEKDQMIVDEVSSNKDESTNKTVKKEDKEKADNQVVENVDQKEPPFGWSHFFRNFIEGLKFLFKKLWWIILLILLIVLCLYLFRNCQGPVSRVNPFYSPLPDTPVIMPVAAEYVGMSEDGLYTVATDRLNILLEKETDQTMLDWAYAFKKAYPSSDYEIKYYNTDIYTLQIKVPADQRIKVKNEIKSRLSGFRFDVFEESVLKADYVSDDTALGDAEASWYLSPLEAEAAWELTRGSEDVVVAVVDNGFDLNHPELTGKIVDPYNVLTRNADIRPIFTKDGVNAHGTHVAATAVGNCNNHAGLLGIAPNCKLMPVQVGSNHPEGLMDNTAIVDGVLYAINKGADVVNVSLGMCASDQVMSMSEAEQMNFITNSFRDTEAIWNNVFQKANEKNCIIVFAAGNENIITGIDPKKRNQSTVRVSSIGHDLKKSDFSNFGRYPQLHREYSTVSAPGESIYSAAPGGKYLYLDGTSMAAPIVSGTVALMRSVNQNLTAEEVIDILQKTGRNVGSEIGPLINIASAVNMAMGNGPVVDCEKIKSEIERYQNLIDSLKRVCRATPESADTLKYDDVIEDPQLLDGLWKSTTELVNENDQSQIELYMQFSNMKGELIIVNKDLRYTAPLVVRVADKKIHIKQTANATNPSSDFSFVSYAIECSADRKGYLFCKATSTTNQVSFNLVRVN